MTITTTPQAAHTTRGHQAVRIPAVGAAGICLAFAGLPVTLAADAPFAEHVWGGSQDRVLPTNSSA